jgi:hypothetical protein
MHMLMLVIFLAALAYLGGPRGRKAAAWIAIVAAALYAVAHL